MVELIQDGVENIVCIQPFGCLPNHVVGKGVIKAIRREYPLANIAAIDYDPGASEVNQLNRIKLMLATAQKNLEKKKRGEYPGTAAGAGENAGSSSGSFTGSVMTDSPASLAAGPEIDSDNASIGCVPPVEEPSSGTASGTKSSFVKSVFRKSVFRKKNSEK